MGGVVEEKENESSKLDGEGNLEKHIVFMVGQVKDTVSRWVGEGNLRENRRGLVGEGEDTGLR